MARSMGGVQAFKPHAVMVAEGAHASCYGETEEQEKRRRMAEEQQWRANVVDLHRVRNLAQTVYLFLEHNNEALLRVAVEIVCCPEASKALWWEETWFSDDVRRDWFRKIVKEKLGMCSKGHKTVFEDDEDDDRVDRTEYDALKARLEKVEGQLDAAERAKRVAEAQIVELEHKLGESSERLKAFEKTADELRKQVREKEEQMIELRKALDEPPPEDPNKGKLEAMEQKMKLIDEQRKKAQERTKELETSLSGMVAPDELQKAKQRFEEMEKMMKEQKASAEKTNKELQDAQKKLTTAEAALKQKEKAPAKPIQEVSTKHTAPKDSDAKIEALSQKAEAERRRASDAKRSLEEARDELAGKHAELAEALKNLKSLETRLQEAQGKCSAAEQETAKARSEAAHAKVELAKALSKPVPKLPEPEPERPPPPPPPAPVEEKAPEPVKQREPEQPKKEEPKKTPRPTPIQGVPQEEHDRLKESLSKSKARNAELNKENIEHKATIADQQDKINRMLKMLHEIKEQLARVSAIAEKKGLGKAVNEILKESKVSETLQSEEYSCFSRLYDDAKRRQEKQRKLHEEKFGVQASQGVQRRGTEFARTGSPSAPQAFQMANHANYATQAFQMGQSNGDNFDNSAAPQAPRGTIYGNFNNTAAPQAPRGTIYGQYSPSVPFGQHPPGNFAHGPMSEGGHDPFIAGSSAPSGPMVSLTPGLHQSHVAGLGSLPGDAPMQGNSGQQNFPAEDFSGNLQQGYGLRQFGAPVQGDVAALPSRRNVGAGVFAPEGYTLHQTQLLPVFPGEYRADFSRAQASIGRTARPFGLAGSASAGALLASSSSFSPRAVASAMVMDARRRERSSSGSPRPVPRRLLGESRSAPKLHGPQLEQLPPLAHERTYDEMFRHTPSTSSLAAVQWGSPTGRLRNVANLSSAAKGHGAHLKSRYSPRESQWRASARKHVEDNLPGKSSIAHEGAVGGLACFSLSGRAPPLV